MSILGSVDKSGAPMGVRMVLAGAEKAGKTTFACGAPGVLLIPLEQGYGGVSVNKTPMLTEWSQVTTLQGEIWAALQKKAFPFRTCVWDTGSALEAALHRHVISLDSAAKGNKTLTMESAHGGYGKAYQVADAMFREFLAFCDALAINYGINTVVTCHVFASKVLDPVQGEYDSFDLLLHSPKNQKTYGKREIISQWADVIGFLYQPMLVRKVENLNQALSTASGRLLGIERKPAHVGGNRYGMKGEITIPEPPANGWNYFANALFEARGIDLFNRENP